MKRLSLNRSKKSAPKEDRQQQKISSFFSGRASSNAAPSDVFKTPETVKGSKKGQDDHEDKDIIEGTPEEKKRKLFKLKKRSSKLGLLVASTTSLLAGNLDKKATKVHSPPKDKKRCLSPENVENQRPKQQKLATPTSSSPVFEPPSQAHSSTPTSSFTKLKSPDKVVTPPTQNIIDDEEDLEEESPTIVDTIPKKESIGTVQLFNKLVFILYFRWRFHLASLYLQTWLSNSRFHLKNWRSISLK